MTTYLSNMLSWAWEENAAYVRWASTRLIGALVLLVTLGWLANISGWMAVNLIPIVIGSLLLIIVGTSPLALAVSALSGKIIPHTEAEGRLARLLQVVNPLSNAASGIELWVRRILPYVLYYFQIIFGLLATFPFAENPIAFWYVAGFGLIMVTAMVATNRLEGSVLYWIVMLYSIAVVLFLLISTAWQNTGISLKDDVLYQQSFDPNSGEPLKMGYVTASGDWIEDPLGRTPTECRPSGYAHFNTEGKAFPYAEHGTCRSPITGERLVPVSKDYVPDASRTTLPGMTDWLFPTPVERKDREAKEEAAAAKAKAERELEIAKANANRPVRPTVYVPVIPDFAVALPACDDQRYARKKDCTKVRFEAGQKYVFHGRANHCRVAKSFGGASLKAEPVVLGNFEREYTAQGAGVAYFFNVPVGEKINGTVCSNRLAL